MLLALEKVNLVKDAGFEKDSDVWHTYTKTYGITSVAVANRHDPDKAFTGDFSGSGDTRTVPEQPGVPYVEDAFLTQGFYPGKTLEDLDTLCFQFSVEPFEHDTSKTCIAMALLYVNAGNPNYWEVGYLFRLPRIPIGNVPHLAFLEIINFPTDTLWHSFKRNIKEEIIDKAPYIPLDASLDSVVLWVEGHRVDIPWQGEKVYWDDISLNGYADYDVGIKGILSGDSVWKATGYTPTARIKNFGRKAADTFLVIAEIRKAETIVYADTLPYSLPADTEDTLSFKEFTPPDASNYTLIVRTIMDPDESDEDDEMSKTLYGSGIAETPSAIQLEITALSSIRYSIPSGEQGTISLYDPSGRRIESLCVQGEGQVAMKAGLSSGVYFVKLESGKTSVTKKAVVLR